MTISAFLAALQLLVVNARTHHDPAAARLVGLTDTRRAHDDSTGREVGALDVPHQVRGARVRVVDQLDHGVDRLAEVVRRDIRGHADGNAAGTVDQQVRVPGRQHDRLAPALVVVRHEVDGLGVDVAQHLDRQRRQPALGVAHGGRRIPVLVAEVPLAVDKRVAKREPLRHPHQRVVGGGVAVGVVLAEHVADDSRALGIRTARLQAALAHREQHTTVHRLESVANVGQRAAHDHAHRVVEIARAHLLRELAGLDPPAVEDVHGHLAAPPSCPAGADVTCIRRRGT